MTGLTRFLERLERVMKWGAAACLMGMALLTCADVVGRAVFNRPIFGTEEMVSMLAVLAVGLSLPYAHSQRSHVGVEMVVSRLRRRTRRRLRLATDTVSLLLFAVVCWRMAEYAATKQASGVVSMNLELPEHDILYCLAGCFLVFALGILKDVLRGLRGEEV